MESPHKPQNQHVCVCVCGVCVCCVCVCVFMYVCIYLHLADTLYSKATYKWGQWKQLKSTKSNDMQVLWQVSVSLRSTRSKFFINIINKKEKQTE